MTDPESLRKRLKKASAESARRTDELLDDELQALSQLTKSSRLTAHQLFTQSLKRLLKSFKLLKK